MKTHTQLPHAFLPYATPPQENGTIIKGISEAFCTGERILVMLKEILWKPITIIF